MQSTTEWTKIKLETGGTLVIDWILAFRLSPKEIITAQVQTCTVAYAQVTCNLQGVQRTPGVLSFLDTPKSTPCGMQQTQSQAGFVRLIRTTLQGWSVQRLCHACAVTLTYIRHTKVAVHVPCTTCARVSVQNVSDRNIKSLYITYENPQQRLA